jgi:hypothetical protein
MWIIYVDMQYILQVNMEYSDHVGDFREFLPFSCPAEPSGAGAWSVGTKSLWLKRPTIHVKETYYTCK